MSCFTVKIQSLNILYDNLETSSRAYLWYLHNIFVQKYQVLGLGLGLDQDQDLTSQDQDQDQDLNSQDQDQDQDLNSQDQDQDIG